MIYHWPLGLLAVMQNAMLNFLWTCSVNISGDVHVYWKKCCMPIKLGGIGLTNLKVFNKTLLSSLGWKIVNNSSFVFQFLRVHTKGIFDARFYLTSSVWLLVKGVMF